MKKLPSQLSNEELLKQLEQQPKEEKAEITSEDYHNDALGFAAFFKLERGEEYFSKKKLYRIYRQWSEDPVGYAAFNKALSVFIPADDSGHFINQKALQLSALAHKMFVAPKKPAKHKSPLHQKRFNAFITTYNIKRGTTPFPLWSLHHFYKEWAGKYQPHRMSYMAFFAFCRLHFVVKRSKHQHRWVQLDKSIFEVFPRDRVLSIYESKVREIAAEAEDKKTKKQVSKSRSNPKS